MSYLLKRPCSHSSCPKFSIGTRFHCGTCGKVWCLEHYHAYPPHVCPIIVGTQRSIKSGGDRADKILEKIGVDRSNDKRAYQRIIDSLDSVKITQQASLIRLGHTCSLIIPSTPDDDGPLTAEYKVGWVNIHLPLVFDDGVKWIVRIPRRHNGDAPADLHSLVASSEVATLQLLHENGAKVPNAWMPVVGNPEEAANGRYFFEEFVEGVPFIDGNYITALEKDRNQYAATLLEFAQHYIAVANTKPKVKGIGSLYPSTTSPCGYVLGPITSMGTFMQPEPPYFLGPFKTLKERYVAHIKQALFHIRSMSFLILDPIRTYAWLLELRDMVMACEVLGREEEDFYIRHADDWFRQSMRDSQGRLTGCLDWEWAYATTKAEAFSSPLNLHLERPWGEGNNALCVDELLMVECFDKLGRPDLGDCIRQGRLYIRLEEALRIDWDITYVRRRGSINGLLQAFRAQGQQVPAPFENDEELRVWLESLVRKRGGNGELDEVGAVWNSYGRVKEEAMKREEEMMEDVVAELYEKLNLTADDVEQK
ncbi:hypothetical protein IAR50_007443 [Cryptococcus sp. DSM 104548]